MPAFQPSDRRGNLEDGQLMVRASFSTSPLSRPTSLVHVLASAIQDYLHFPSPDPLYTILGATAGNILQGAPVWLVLIGAPSSGRTVLLNALAGLKRESPIPGVHIVGGGIKGPAAFLSGTGQKDIKKGATGGLLREIGSRGILVLKDFSSMLAMAKEPLSESIDVLRQVFDGFYSRPIGVDGGKHLEWKGRIGFIAASTPAIDRHTKTIGDLGERWIYYRYPTSTGYGETIKALGHDNPGKMMEDLEALITAFFEALGLEWDQERRQLSMTEKERLYALSSLSTAARSVVSRDQWRGNEVDDLTLREGPARLGTELGQFYLGLEAIGLDEPERWRLCAKVAMDSVKRSRMHVLLEVKRARKEITIEEIAALTPIGKKSLEVIIQDLTLHGLLEYTKHGRNGHSGDDGLRLTPWARKQLEYFNE